jgi:hypothetical protein
MRSNKAILRFWDGMGLAMNSVLNVGQNEAFQHSGKGF